MSRETRLFPYRGMPVWLRETTVHLYWPIPFNRGTLLWTIFHCLSREVLGYLRILLQVTILRKLLSVLGDKPIFLSRGLQVAVIHRVYLHYKAESEANNHVHGVRVLVLSVTLKNGLFHLMSRPPSLSGVLKNFICPGVSYCNTCFVIHFYIVLSGSQTLQLSVVQGGLEVLQRFVTGCSSVGGGGVMDIK